MIIAWPIFSLILITAKKLDQLPAVDIQHARAKLPSKLHMFAYVDFLAQSLCSVHSNCAVCTVTVHPSFVESILEKVLSNTTSFLGLSACQLQEVEHVFPPVRSSSLVICEMKIEPQSDTMVFGVPCNFQMFPSIKRVSPSALSVLLQGMKWAIFVRRSTTVRMLSNPSEEGRSVIKS